MARQSSRKRKVRYAERHKAELEHYRKLLRRQHERVFSSYYDHLTPQDKSRIKWHLSRAVYSELQILALQVGIRSGGSYNLKDLRSAYFAICKILRKAGNNKPKPTSSNKVILRKR
jgi:hypothetical protein